MSAAPADLGRLDGPVLAFGGCYGNLEATRAVLAAARRHGIPAARTICTGDVVAYCADPAATIAALRAAGVHVVLGNCEESLAADAPGCGCGFAAGSTCDRLSAQWYAYTRDRTGPTERAWMAGLPRHLRFTLGTARVVVVHGAPSRINRYVFASTAAADKRRELGLAGADVVVAGHSGLPFTQQVAGGVWHNAGAVGLPANDGTPRTWYSILTPVAGGLAIAHHPLVYDHVAAQARMRAAGLPEAYATTLGTGLWDNCDILPAAETAARGVPLSPPPLLWRLPAARPAA